ncbi:MAG: archease [Desulfobacterales bacterium]|jgi:SHS2 domain-containing protein
MPYRFIDEIATADVAFEASGADLEEVFTAAAEALLAVTVADHLTVRGSLRKTVTLVAESEEMLLFDFLQELVFLKDRDQTLLRVDRIDILPGKEGYHLEAKLAGEQLDYDRHDLVVDVKAVTMHQFHLAPTPDGWQARIVLDI